MDIASIPTTVGAGEPARRSGSRMYSLSKSLMVPQARCVSGTTSWTVMVWQRRPTQNEQRLVSNGWSANQSNVSCFTLPHRQPSTPLEPDTAGFRVADDAHHGRS